MGVTALADGSVALAAPGVTVREEAGARILALSGRVDTPAAAALWPRLMEEARRPGPPLRLDLASVEAVDTTGATLLLTAAAAGARIEGASPGVTAVLDRVRDALAAPRPKLVPYRFSPLHGVGRRVVNGLAAGVEALAFLGELLFVALATLVRPGRLRGRELLRHLDEAGTRAFGLATLLGALLGVILAFQSAIPLRQFGAEIFVPSLVGISLLRELGPLMAGVVLAGRTGSAYAAELGTMTVNEEVAALRIMGIDPMALLVLPRVLAGMLVMPVLSLVLTLAGLVGMALIMRLLGFQMTTVAQQLVNFVSLKDLLGGLFKAAVFGLAIAFIGCRAGLGAGRGPRAVGDAATAAVVGGIVAIVLLDGAFAVLFERLGL
ncbi:ABC transporter permease [Falsiroseomonas selenitidurans]|uniref:ABC transporter permease n=1 Tax=Falsiroseomonas selenitidurans TaxID=2716335 RepID=UPI002E29507A|nr:ABC transporter permease [Falsiroseomonas selenitidurans]